MDEKNGYKRSFVRQLEYKIHVTGQYITYAQGGRGDVMENFDTTDDDNSTPKSKFSRRVYSSSFPSVG